MIHRIFIGYDERESVAYHVLAHSIMRRSTMPVSITPLIRSQLMKSSIYTRERGPLESTDFSMTRFLVPHLCNYDGYALFVDCDILCQMDVMQIFRLAESDPGHALWVAKHDYIPKSSTKFLGNAQTSYPRKNWSSVMLFRNTQCQALTPWYVNQASGQDLHRFAWLRPSQTIGDLPLEYNWLVGEYADRPDAGMLHYTLGGPWFDETKHCPQADLWTAERDAMLGAPCPIS